MSSIKMHQEIVLKKIGLHIPHVFKQTHFVLVFLTLFSVLMLSVVNCATAQSNIESPQWQVLASKTMVNQGVFNSALRRSVREDLVLPDILSDKMQTQSNMISRLQTLDKGLSRYIRISERVSRFEQLKRLMPALRNIEERRLIEQWLRAQGKQVPRLRNTRLLSFLDKRITLLANGLIFNMKALVRERRSYEPELLKAMAKYGVKFSARPPDFILDYELVSEGQDDQNKWKFEASIALLGKYELPIVTVQTSQIEQAENEQKAQVKAVNQLAKLLTTKLKKYLIKKSKS